MVLQTEGSSVDLLFCGTRAQPVTFLWDFIQYISNQVYEENNVAVFDYLKLSRFTIRKTNLKSRQIYQICASSDMWSCSYSDTLPGHIQTHLETIHNTPLIRKPSISHTHILLYSLLLRYNHSHAEAVTGHTGISPWP